MIIIITTAYTVPPVLSTMGIIANKLRESLELLNLRPALHIPVQEYVILNTRHSQKVFGRTS